MNHENQGAGSSTLSPETKLVIAFVIGLWIVGVIGDKFCY